MVNIPSSRRLRHSFLLRRDTYATVVLAAFLLGMGAILTKLRVRKGTILAGEGSIVDLLLHGHARTRVQEAKVSSASRHFM